MQLIYTIEILKYTNLLGKMQLIYSIEILKYNVKPGRPLGPVSFAAHK